MTSTERERLQKALIAEENLVQHVYKDSLGYWTIGVGRLVDERKGGGLSHMECLYLLNNDIDSAVASLLSRHPWYLTLSPPRQHVLLQMTFQMGADGVSKFVNTLAAMKHGDYEAASRGMLASKWGRVQTPERARRLAAIMRSGAWPEPS